MVIGRNSRQNPAYCPICNCTAMKNNDNPNFQRRPNQFLPVLLKIIAGIALLALIITAIFFVYKKNQSDKITLKTIKKYWNVYDYEKVYESGKVFLQEQPYNNAALTYFGFACFYLSVSQNDTSLSQEYLDECINNLRLALYEADKSAIPQIQYFLGKAYFQKNVASSYYYSDLAIKYLSLAKQNGYSADDISQYLGLCYDNLGMTMESLSSFLDALVLRESDTLLLSVAKQYYKLKNYDAAEQYLYRIINYYQNDDKKLESKILLGNIYFEKNNYEQALQMYNDVIEHYQNSADAHYGIGLIYEKEGNMVKARAEWRQALKIQVNHTGALKKLSIY